MDEHVCKHANLWIHCRECIAAQLRNIGDEDDMEPTTKLDDVWEQIAALRASYENTIERASAMIAEANELKRKARKALDELPVAKTRRKSPGRKLADAVITDPTPTYGDCEPTDD